MGEFWSGQIGYIEHIYRPVILGTMIFLVAVLGLFAFGLYRHYRLLRMGGNENRFDKFLPRLKTTFSVSIAHMRIINEPYPGIMHLLIFWGAALFIVGKLIRPFSFAVTITNPPQPIFLYASLISEVGALMIIIGGLIAIYRRYIAKPSRLDTKADDTLIYAWVFIILLTGFMAKGYRIAAGVETDGIQPTDWARWAPISYGFAKILPTFDTVKYNEVLVWHRAVLHTVPAFMFLVYIMVNRSRMQHVLLGPLNIFFRSLGPKGALVPVNLEEAESFGVAKIEGFTWKQLLDLDACTRCGRCQDNCPAHLSGKTLSPKKLVQDLKQHWWDVGPDFFALFRRKKEGEARPSMIGDVITHEMIWDCTTCRACQEACPVYIEHINKVIDMRRNLVLDQAEMPETAEMALRCIEERGHTCKGTTACRTDWCGDIAGAKLLANDNNVEILYFVGCSAALEERNMKVSKAFGKILRAANVNFGILGEEESCCGDPARRLGNEYLFQMQAMKNIETFKKYNVKKIVVTCPHGYNCLKNEYPQFGGEFEVIHHSQYIAELIKEGRLKLKNNIDKAITYHDGCYLGRHNSVYDEPRKILNSLPGVKFKEMARCKNKSFCCGAGGGHMWMEEKTGVRISEMRTEQALETNSSVVATACPFCLQMFEDAIKAKEASEKIRPLDIAELVAQAIADEPPQK